MTTAVVWEDPPETSTRWSDVLGLLRAQPGRWARVADGLTVGQARDRVRYLRRRCPAARGGCWEFRAGRVGRPVDPSTPWAVWARCTPEEGATP